MSSPRRNTEEYGLHRGDSSQRDCKNLGDSECLVVLVDREYVPTHSGAIPLHKYSERMILADLDGDDWLDLVTVTTFAEQPRIYMNLGENAKG